MTDHARSAIASTAPPTYGRLGVELRVLALLALLTQLHVAQAAAWALLVLDDAALEQLRGQWWLLAIPTLALLMVMTRVAVRMPTTRWPRHAGPSPWPLALLGWPALPSWIPLWLRDRRARERQARGEDIELAFRELLALPRIAAATFAGWIGAATIACAAVLATSLALDPWTLGLLVALWLSLLLPLVALALGRTRAMLVPEYLAAPRPHPSEVPMRRSLRLRLGVPAGLLVIAAVLGPLLAGVLWANPSASAMPLLSLAALIGLTAGLTALVPLVRDVDRDLGRATRQVCAVAEGQVPGPLALATFATAELRELVAAVDRLVARITDANVSKYVLIERGREADRLKSQFLANMSHDLRSPLNSVLGFSELLTTGIEGELTSDQREMVVAIHVAGKQLLQQIDDILDTAKIDAGRMELHREPTPAATLISRAIQRARPRLPERVELRQATAAGLPSAFVDPYRTVQAVENVLVFAGSTIAQEPSGPTESSSRPKDVAAERKRPGIVDIECQLERVDAGSSEIVIRVAAPYSAAVIERLAQAQRGFFRLPGHTGLGLGLPIASAILELQGGSLRIESDGRTRDTNASSGSRARGGVVATHREAHTPAHDQDVMIFELRMPALAARRAARIRDADKR